MTQLTCSTGGGVIKMISIRSAAFDEDTIQKWPTVGQRISYLRRKYRFPQEDTPEIVRDRQTYLDDFPITDARW